MIRLRPYKPCDAETILGWIKDEDVFRKWSADRYDHYPITAADMNHKYIDCNGDYVEPDNFYPMTAFDESGIVGGNENGICYMGNAGYLRRSTGDGADRYSVHDDFEYMACGVVAGWGENGQTIIRICELEDLLGSVVFGTKTENL